MVGSKPIFENLFHDVNVINLIFPGGTPPPLDPRMKPILTNNQSIETITLINIGHWIFR